MEKEKQIIAEIEKAKIAKQTSFSLRRWGIYDLPVEIGTLTNLTDLNLSENNLDSLPVEIINLEKLTRLDLSRNHFREIPKEICEISSLEELNLNINYLQTITHEISKLTNLIFLDLSTNNADILPSEIALLTNLISLDLSRNRIEFLPPEIGKLKDLKTLNLFNNKLNNLPNEFWNLTKLIKLDLGNNNLAEISSKISSLKHLNSMDVSNNDLAGLPAEIGMLTELSTLMLSSNRLISLPPEIRKLSNLVALDLNNNLLPRLPPEISNKPADILSYYLDLQITRRPLHEAKCLFVGQGSVGKTSLINRIRYGTFDQNQIKTEGISINQWEVKEDLDSKFAKKKSDFHILNNNSQIRLNIWDFGGQEIMHATHQFFLTKRSLYLLVLDSRLTQEENRVEYWLKIIQSFSEESPVLIVGNKIDQHPLDIDRTGLQKKYPNIVGIIETSAANGSGIEELKTAIAAKINKLPHVRDLVPETWFTVKTELETLGKNQNFITRDEYLSLCDTYDVKDETSKHTLIGFLHDLGVVLHFQDDPRLEALGILNPQWVTNGVYKILNSHALFQNKGVLTVSMLDEILNLPEYPRGKRLFIVDMMKKFELCYDIEADKIFLVPDLLPKDESAELKFNGVPAFEYAYPVLPSSVITRFIVRMNQKIDDGFVWRTGVVLKIGENKALVKADIEDRKITIAIDGLEHTRRDALSAIRFQLDEIHSSIKGLNPEKYVPVPGAVSAKPLKYDYLLKLERDGEEILKVEDGDKLKKVNIAQVLNGVESEYQRKQYGNVINIGGNVTDSTIIAGDENEVNK